MSSIWKMPVRRSLARLASSPIRHLQVQRAFLFIVDITRVFSLSHRRSGAALSTNITMSALPLRASERVQMIMSMQLCRK